MASSQLTFKDHLLNNLWKIKQAQRIGDCRARLANSLRQGLLSHTTRIDELSIPLSLFDGVEIRALQIFNQCKRKHLFIINIFYDDRKFLKSSELRSLITALTRDNLIAIIVLAYKKRLKNTMLLNRLTQLSKLGLIKMNSGLVGVWNYIFDWKFSFRSSIGCGRRRSAGLIFCFGDQCIESATQTATLPRARHA